MSDPLVSARYMLEHAHRRIDEADGIAGVFQKDGPYTAVMEPNREGTKDIFKVKLNRPLPDVLHGVTFDAVNALRAALDHAGYAVAVAADPTKGDRAHFPFGEDKLDRKSTRLNSSH